MPTLPAVMKPIAITRSLSIRRLPDGVELPSRTGLHLPLLRGSGDHLNVTNPFNIVNIDFPLDCNICMGPRFSIDFGNLPSHNTVILSTTEDGRIVGRLDAEFHFTGSYGDDHAACGPSPVRLHVHCEYVRPRYRPSGHHRTVTNQTDSLRQSCRMCGGG
jgi:hypothetical protein